MTLSLYNTLTRRKDPFQPIDPNNVRMYVCGPTVYDFAHIGNARPVIVFDVLFRLLRHIYGPDQVTYVRNITDVDDKINARALRDFPGLPLNDAIARVTEKTASQYHADVKALGCLEPTHEPRATDNIAQMIAIIEQLLAKRHAYVAAGEVLFDTQSMPDYGQLSNRKLEEQQAGARVEVDAHKKNAGDFVLWKLSAADEPGWDSPWGRGRPGWHIECSAMSERYLGPEFDIHGGGLDLIFPHHENEIAQSRCAHGTDVMANVWMHNGFLQVEGEKMSKSLGNFVTINELLETAKFGGRPWEGSVVRFAMLKTHYRQPIDWTRTLLVEARQNLDDLASIRYDFIATSPSEKFLQALADDLNTKSAIDELLSLAKSARDGVAEAGGALAANLKLLGFFEEEFGVKFPSFGAADDELAMSGILRELLSIIPRNVTVRQIRHHFLQEDHANPLPIYVRNHISMLIGRAGDSTFSIEVFGDRPRAERVEEGITARLEARKRKDFKESDRIRDELASMGIALKDTKNKETGEIETTWEVAR